MASVLITGRGSYRLTNHEDWSQFESAAVAVCELVQVVAHADDVS